MTDPVMRTAPADAAALKAHLRAEALARRAAMEAEARAAASAAAAAHAVRALGDLTGATIALFAAFGDEIDTRPLATALRAKGALLVLPVVIGRERPLVFRVWEESDPLIPRGPFRIPTPDPAASEAVPDLLFVPLAAFDARGYRIGYGGGFYDRTLAHLRANGPVRAIGYAFACQHVPHVPDEPHDERVDEVITEGGALSVAGSFDAHSLSR